MAHADDTFLAALERLSDADLVDWLLACGYALLASEQDGQERLSIGFPMERHDHPPPVVEWLVTSGRGLGVWREIVRRAAG